MELTSWDIQLNSCKLRWVVGFAWDFCEFLYLVRPPPETRALYFSEVFAVAEAEDGRCKWWWMGGVEGENTNIYNYGVLCCLCKYIYI